MDPLIAALLRRGLKTAYYMADARAIPSIAEKGILSLCEAKRRDLNVFSIANQSVQQKRAARLVFNATPLHEYVPLYFAWFTGMQKEVEANPSFTSQLIFADISLRKLGEVTNSAVLSDENAARHQSKFSNNPNEAAWIDESLVARVHTTYRSVRRVQMRPFELLIRREVPSNCITQFVCKTELTRALLRRQFNPSIDTAIIVDPTRFYSSKAIDNARRQRISEVRVFDPTTSSWKEKGRQS